MVIKAKYYSQYNYLSVEAMDVGSDEEFDASVYSIEGDYLGKMRKAKEDGIWSFQDVVNEISVINNKLVIEINGDKTESYVEFISGKVFFSNFDTNLVICKPFLPNSDTDKLHCNFYFVSPDHIDLTSIEEMSKAYKNIYIEKDIADKVIAVGGKLAESIEIIDNCVQIQDVSNEMRVAFLASSDTHVAFMLKLAEKIPNHIFLIPAKHCKDDAAADALDKAGKSYIEIDYKATECEELISFNPYYVYSATDWTSEFLAVQRIVKSTDIRLVALQEGPEDWHLRFYQNGVLKVLNHYRNADIFFSQGSRSMFFIRPQYFAIPGNPKIDRIERESLPERPKVLINCNFTYLNTKPAYESKREMWMESVLRVCKKVGIDYIISKHPRDDSEWDDPNLIKSNAFTIREQILSCSISISRFSSIPYETLAQSRKSIYYNNHLEPMPTFMEDKNGEVMIVTEEDDLERILIEHMKDYPYVMNEDSQINYLERYAGKQDGHGLDRVTIGLSEIAKNRWITGNNISVVLGEQMEVISRKDTWNIAFFAAPSISGVQEYVAHVLAETSAAGANKVFYLAKEYSDLYGEFFDFEYHKDIEYVLTRDFSDALEREHIDYVFFFGDIETDRLIYENAKTMAVEKRAELLIINKDFTCEMESELQKRLLGLVGEYSEKFESRELSEKDWLDLLLRFNELKN